MILSIREINEKEIDLCCELDSSTISLWSKTQWTNEFKKRRYKSLWISSFKFNNRNMRFSCSFR